jgi:hypothetical protein
VGLKEEKQSFPQKIAFSTPIQLDNRAMIMEAVCILSQFVHARLGAALFTVHRRAALLTPLKSR